MRSIINRAGSTHLIKRSEEILIARGVTRSRQTTIRRQFQTLAGKREQNVIARLRSTGRGAFQQMRVARRLRAMQIEKIGEDVETTDQGG